MAEEGIDLSQFGQSFEKLPKLNEELKKAGSEAMVIFQNNGRKIDADVLAKAYKIKNIKGIKAQDTFVYEVLHNSERKALFVGSKSFTNLRELAAIQKANNGTLSGARVKISRIAENDPNTANYKYEAA